MIETIKKGDVFLLQSLLDHGMDPNIPNSSIQYPLHFSSLLSTPNSLEMTRLLIKNYAKCEVKDGAGWTPIQYAIFTMNVDVYEFFKFRMLVDNESDSEFTRRNAPDFFMLLPEERCRNCGLQMLFFSPRRCNVCNLK